LVHRQQSFKWHYTTADNADMQFISLLLCHYPPPLFNPSICRMYYQTPSYINPFFMKYLL
jgi:hypothetical protein